MSKPRPKSSVTVSKQRLYEVVRRPVITEKATLLLEHNQVAFVVALDATKPEIKAAVWLAQGHLPLLRKLAT